MVEREISNNNNGVKSKMSKKETLHIYVRTSTDNQDVKRQIEMGKKFSTEEKMNHKIWSDGGKSGLKSFEDTREELTELMFLVDIGSVKHIWVEDYTRLTRLIDDQMKIDTLIMNNNLHIYEGLSGNKEYQPEDMVQRLFQTMKTMMGSETKKDEIKKSISTKLSLFKSGLYVRGNVTYGFTKVDGYLQENEEESKWVRKIFKWYSEGHSLRSVMRKLKVYNVKTKRGNDWSSEGVSICLKNREYIGVTKYTDMTKDPHRTNPKLYPYQDESKWEVWTNENLPRIVSDELFDRCQKQLTIYKPQMTKYKYFLHGKIKCNCGCDWVGRKQSVPRGEYFYYMCNNSSRRYYSKPKYGRNNLYKKGICNKPKRISTENLDSWVWNTLMETLKDSTIIKERVKNNLLGNKYDTSSSRRRVNTEHKDIYKEIKSLERSRVSLLKERFLYELSESDFKDIDYSISQKITQLKSDLQEVIEKQTILDNRTKWIDWISEHHRGVNEYEKLTDVKKRRKVLDIYVDNVEMYYDEIRYQHEIQIYFRYPLVDDSIQYTKNDKTKISWDKWGKSYRIKKGNKVVSLSSISRDNMLVKSVYSTVTDLAKLRG